MTLLSCLLLNDDVLEFFCTLVIGIFRTPEPFFPCCFNGGRLETLLRGEIVAADKLAKKRTPSKNFENAMFAVMKKMVYSIWHFLLGPDCSAFMSAGEGEALSKSASPAAPNAHGVPNSIVTSYMYLRTQSVAADIKCDLSWLSYA
jgi:hypothetical protein